MNKNLIENRIQKLNEVKDFLIKNYPDGIFSVKINSIPEILGFNNLTTAKNYIKTLLDEGFLKVLKAPERIGMGKWSDTVFQITHVANAIDNKNVADSKQMKTEYIEETFNNNPIKLFNTDKGYVISIRDIASSLKTNWDTINMIIERNNELFKDFVCYVSNVTLGTQKCLTRDGIIGLLMKISYNRLSEERKSLVLEFQKWAISKLSKLIADGKVELTEQEHAKVQSQIKNIIDIPEEELDKLMENLKVSIDKKLEVIKQKIQEKNEKIRIAEFEKQKAISREQKLIAKIPQLVEQRLEIIMSKM